MKLKLLFSHLAIISLVACGQSEDERLLYFKNQISTLLKESESREVVASELTNFTWDRLCFNRYDDLKLEFHSVNSDVVFRLSYTDYFVDEAYVENSLDKLCISNKERILLIKKFPGPNEVIYLMKSNK